MNGIGLAPVRKTRCAQPSEDKEDKIVKGVNEVKDNSGIVWILGEIKEILFE